MASLIVLKFDAPDGAEKGLELAQSLQKQQLLQIVDGAIVAWPKGKKRPKTRHAPLGALGALDGAFWGTLIGFIFFVPFFGMALGATMGALGGHFADHGISDDFIQQVRAKVTEEDTGQPRDEEPALHPKSPASCLGPALRAGLPRASKHCVRCGNDVRMGRVSIRPTPRALETPQWLRQRSSRRT